MKTIVLDIETIMDQPAAERCHYRNSEDFPPWPVHALACISTLTVERVDRDRLAFSIRTLSRTDMSERGMLQELEQHLSSANQVLSFNGRGFDVPVLLTRAAISGVEVPTIMQLHSRTRLNFHLDLLDVVTSNGAAPKIKLAHLCAAFEIPAKIEAGGEGVADLAAAGDYVRIGRYCETDVVATWLAAQMWQSTHAADFGRERWARLAEWVAAEQPRLEHLLPYANVPERALYAAGPMFPDDTIVV